MIKQRIPLASELYKYYKTVGKPLLFLICSHQLAGKGKNIHEVYSNLFVFIFNVSDQTRYTQINEIVFIYQLLKYCHM